ncbi:MAG: YkgJ family cysteine cluster protein [Chitinophagales bacterium]|nr:YkgJ family cysteine cluster protein [Chitinophagales bacterium]
MKPEYQHILHEALINKEDSLESLKSLKKQANHQLVESLKSCHQEVFSKIDCLACANCCKTSPPLVTNKDIKRIAQHLKMTPKLFERKYVIEDINGEKSFSQVPCFFLQEDNRCSIYEVRPEACRNYPHTDEDAYFIRTSLNLNNTLICPAAFLILKKIKSITDLK